MYPVYGFLREIADSERGSGYIYRMILEHLVLPGIQDHCIRRTQVTLKRLPVAKDGAI